MNQMKLHALLWDMHMSQAECARRAGINPTSLSRILSGKEPVFPYRARRIAKAVGWDGEPAELFETTGGDE